EALAEGLHGAGAAGVDDLEAAAVGAGARPGALAVDEARADAAAAVGKMAGLAEPGIDPLARRGRVGIARIGVFGGLVELLHRRRDLLGPQVELDRLVVERMPEDDVAFGVTLELVRLRLILRLILRQGGAGEQAEPGRQR